ncbi:sigma 54-interacting transcriptional regulator [Caballeronia jiangsuensis]
MAALIHRRRAAKLRRVGAEKDVECNFRLVCATHRDLQLSIASTS